MLQQQGFKFPTLNTPTNIILADTKFSKPLFQFWNGFVFFLKSKFDGLVLF